jgi:saxitoxin biosynthesis operon SxtJ-like protein
MVNKDVTREQSKDTGMALVLMLLLAGLASGRNGFLVLAMAFHVVNMIVPRIFRPAAVVWFAVSHLLGMVVSKVVLSLVFFVVVTPMAVLRRALGRDSLQLRAFRDGRGSVMTERNHLYTGRDIELPY